LDYGVPFALGNVISHVHNISFLIWHHEHPCVYKLVQLATLVHMDIKAFPSCPSVPLLIANSIVHQLKVAVPLAPHCFTQCSPGALMAFSSRPSVPLRITNRRNFILFMTAMKYVNRSRCHSQIAFPTEFVLVRNCEDESRILNDLH
ncbi:hypothetical protein T02_6980, partial [Trichinella nativa]